MPHAIKPIPGPPQVPAKVIIGQLFDEPPVAGCFEDRAENEQPGSESACGIEPLRTRNLKELCLLLSSVKIHDRPLRTTTERLQGLTAQVAVKD